MNYKTFRQDLERIGLDRDEIKDVLAEVNGGYGREAFEVGDFRLIHEHYIDDIMKDELSSDTYVLGCFDPPFIADILDISVMSVIVLQENDLFEDIGESMLKYIDEVVEKYVSCDGYGHHFARYDDEEHRSEGYYIFRIN